MHFTTVAKVSLVACAVLGWAHPGEHEVHDHALDLARRQYKAQTRRGLEACAEKMEKRGLNARAHARRMATVQKHAKRDFLAERDTNATLAKSHHSNRNITANTPEDVIFASNGTCILNPEGETGPYWVKGELLRNNLREGQPGVPLILDGQFVDVETCEPITGLYWDVWNCNSTGVYSGVVAEGNGNEADTSNLNKTFLRGVAPSDSDGVVQFETIFPGHYSGRTTHIHMIAHLNATVLPNSTLSGGTVAHIGQIFWDQDLIYDVEATYPYNTNNITITLNADDRVVQTETEDSTSDPFIEYVYLGDDLSDGLFGWITVAVNTSASYDPNYSFVHTASGDVAESGGTVSVD